MRGEGWYYTPISVEGQLVEKRVETIVVARDSPAPTLTVRYTLTNPYAHPISVPVQSGLTLLYEFAPQPGDGREPELHVVPATVTNLANGELLYAADAGGPSFGTTAIQRRHLGTGVPNYRHPITVNLTLVPGDRRRIQAVATIPPAVERMILVDAMVGPGRDYGIYPQLLADPANEGRVPPPLRVFEGARFSSDPPRLRIAPGQRRGRARSPVLPGWLNPRRFARLQRVFQDAGRLWICTVGVGSTLLSLSVALRWFIVGLDTAAIAEAARSAGFVALTIGAARGNRYVRLVFALALAASAAIGLVQVAIALASGAVPYVVLLTEATMIPILYAGGALVLSRAPSVRAFTGTIRLPWPPRRSIVDHDL